MLFSADFINLILYSFQQLGVMLGVGAETIVLVAYLLAIRDGTVDSQEERFARAVKHVLYTGLGFILFSGIAITLMEMALRNGAIVIMPAYLFKVLLIAIVLVLARFTRGNTFTEGLTEGFAGATWYALFVVHILAPVASWGQLFVLYAAWATGFTACWVTIVFMMRGGKGLGLPSMSSMKFQMPKMLARSVAVSKAAPGISPSVPAAPASSFEPPAPEPASQPQSLQSSPGTAPRQDAGLAKVRVMPKSWEDLHAQNPAAVRFN